MRLAIALAALTVVAIGLTAQARSKWVYAGDDGRLHYGVDTRGNRIMDFSPAGFKGGGVALPAVSVARTIAPTAGDSTSHIQSAIDGVPSLPRGNEGVRGAGLLEGRTD